MTKRARAEKAMRVYGSVLYEASVHGVGKLPTRLVDNDGAWLPRTQDALIKMSWPGVWAHVEKLRAEAVAAVEEFADEQGSAHV